MKYMLLMNAPRGTGDYQVNQWSPEDFQAHIGFMHQFNQELMASGEWVDAQGLAAPGSGVPATGGVPHPGPLGSGGRREMTSTMTIF